MEDLLALSVYAAPLALIWLYYLYRWQRRHRAALATLTDNRAAGLVEPASLHPVIDASRCVGCGACVAVCPEMPAHQVLGILNGKATLIAPENPVSLQAGKSHTTTCFV